MKKRTIQKRTYWIILVFIALGIALFPLFKHGFFMTDDGDWMIIRLSAFYQSFREGQFPVRFLGRLNLSYGYPIANFLYPGFLYLGSVIHAVGFSFENSIKIIMGLSFVVSGLFGYLWLRTFFGSFASAVGAFTIPLAPYMLFDAYKRGSVGELLAVSLSLLCLWSIEKRKYWLLPLVYGFFLTSHNTVALMFSIVLVFYVIARKEWWAFKSMLIGLGLASFFWIPALYERKYVMFDEKVISNPFEYFATGETIYLLHAVQVFCAFAWLILIRKKQMYEKVLVSIFLLMVFFASALSAPFWSMSPIARLVQFPYRFLGVGCVFGSFFVARVLDEWKNINRFMVIIIIGVVLWYTYSAFSHIRFVARPEGFYSTNEATTTVSDEYLPKWITTRPLNRSNERLSLFSGNGKIIPIQLSTQTVKAEIEANELSIIQINNIYYPGWGVTLDGIPQVIDYKSTDGLMRINIPPGKHILFAQFRETGPRFLADCLSCMSLFVYVWYINKVRKDKGKKQ
jgi:hypothetical protein